uniref:Uncharacterized protein n=1 Tax=Tanacetum cinerariifolium TaxID=118510 RepID=A0A699IC74_TANCI|nr:hypothetical protein [Tanacetum cinerariifolium]
MVTSNNPYTFPVLHQDQPSLSTYMQQPLPNNNIIPQPSFNQNYMQQPMPNPKDITDPTTAMNMELALMAKTFRLNYSTTTRGFHQTLVIGRLLNRNVGNQNGLTVVPGIANQNLNGNGNLVAARARADLDEIEEVNANCILMANLQQASTSGTQTDKAPIYDSDGSAEVHNYDNCYDNEIFNMFTQEEQYTELLEPVPEPHQVPQNDNNIIYEVSSVEQSEGIVEQHPANVEETRVLYDSLCNNLAIEVEKVNTVNRKLRETNAELTTELARYKTQEKCFEISQEQYDKLERCYQKSVYQEQYRTKKINALHLSFDKQITNLNEEISDLNKQLLMEKSTVSTLLEEKKKLKSDFKIREDELLDKEIQLENKIKELDNILVKTSESSQTMHMLSPKPDSFYHTEQKMALGYQNPFYLKKDTATCSRESSKNKTIEQRNKIADESLAKYKALKLEIERLLRAVKLENENIELEFHVLNYAKENAHLKTTYKNLFDSIIIDSFQNKLHDTIYENAKLRAWLFDKVSEQKETTRGTSANTKFAKQSILGKPPSSFRPKLYAATPLPKSMVFPKVGETHALSKPVTSNSVPTPTESIVVNNERVIAPGIFKINPFKASKVDNFVPNEHVKASVRTKPITVSQPHVITKNDVKSKTNGFSPKDVKALPRPENHCLRTILIMIRLLLSLKVVGSRIT